MSCKKILRAMALGCLLHGAAVHAETNLWLAETQSLRHIDTQLNTVSPQIPAPGIAHMAPDGSGGLWALGGTWLKSFDSKGRERIWLEADKLGLKGDKRWMRADPRDGSLWLADETRLLHIGSDGKTRASHLVPDQIRGLAIIPDQSVLVIGMRFIWHFEPDEKQGVQLLGSTDFAALQTETELPHFMHDPVRNRLWIGGEKSLYRFQLPDYSNRKAIPLPQAPLSIAFDIRNERLWVLSRDRIAGYTGGEAPVENIDLRLYGIQGAKEIAYDAATGDMWLHHAAGISRLNIESRHVTHLPRTQAAVTMEAAPPALRPAIGLVQPQQGADIAADNETFVLKLEGRCVGSVCAPASYAKSLSLDAQLSTKMGAQKVGESFVVDPRTGLSSYTAFDLPVGPVKFDAQATDRFGQQSNRVDADFKVTPSAAVAAQAGAASAGDESFAGTVPSSDKSNTNGGKEVVLGDKAEQSALSVEEAARQNFLRLPLQFALNRGQFDGDIRFMSRGPGYLLSLSAGRADIQLPRRKQSASNHGADADTEASAQGGASLGMQFIGANIAARVVGLDELPGKSHYFQGRDSKKWHIDVPNFARVKYEGVYPGIDKIYYGKQSQLEYDWIVAPGADPNLIRQKFESAQSIDIDANGDLLIETSAGTVRQKKPVAYQDANGAHVPVEAHYVLANGEVHLRVGEYDKGRSLVIDPVVYGYTTNYGGGGQDLVAGLKIDKDFNAYIATTAEMPGKATDIAVYKINSTGTALLYSAFYGGTKEDAASGIALTAAGEVYVAGVTASVDFPTLNAIQTDLEGPRDAVIFRLNAAGNGLVFSTYYGGSGEDVATSIALDSKGAPYIGGYTNSIDFPRRGPQPTNYGGGSSDGFVVKLTAGGARAYGNYVGGSGKDVVTAVAADQSGFVHIAGYTDSPNLPLANAYQAQKSGGVDAFFGKRSVTQGPWALLSYLGGSANDYAYAIQVDDAGGAYVAGTTGSDNFPSSEGAFQNILAGMADGFVSKFDSLTGSLVYSTFLGGEGNDGIAALALDAQRQAYVSGYSDSQTFPAVRMTRAPADTAVVAKLLASGKGVVYAGSIDHLAKGDVIAVDKKNNAYVAGIGGADSGKPISGENDVFVVKLLPPNDPIALTSSRNPSGAGAPVTFVATVSGTKLLGPVVFKNGTAALATVTLADGTASLTTTLPAGTHSITARYMGDSNNPALTSPTLTQVVVAGEAPTAVISKPIGNSTYVSNTPIPFSITATASPGRSVYSVALLVDGVPASAAVLNPPGGIVNGSHPGLPIGTHRLSARVLDNVGVAATSAEVVINVIGPPVVTLTAPAQGQRFDALAAMRVTADATSANGPIVKVDFFQGATLIGTDTTAPYAVSWKNIAAGQYVVTAVATDSLNLPGTSPPVTINVVPFVGPKITYVHADFAGSPFAATDDNGVVLWKESYRPYGVRQKDAAAAKEQRQSFHSKEEDRETGLQYFGARYYDPDIGRFMGMDAVGVIPGNIHSFNRYAYGHNNPYKYLDPDGRWVGFVVAAVGLWALSDNVQGPARPNDAPVLMSTTERVTAVGLVLAGGGGASSLISKGIAGQAAKEVVEETAAKGGTYVLKNAEGTVVRTGRTKDLAQRERQHGRDHPDKTFEVDKRTDSYPAQRGREQDLHDANPSAHAENGGLDKINGISPNNPMRDEYLRAGRELP